MLKNNQTRGSWLKWLKTTNLPSTTTEYSGVGLIGIVVVFILFMGIFWSVNYSKLKQQESKLLKPTLVVNKATAETTASESLTANAEKNVDSDVDGYYRTKAYYLTHKIELDKKLIECKTKSQSEVGYQNCQNAYLALEKNKGIY